MAPSSNSRFQPVRRNHIEPMRPSIDMMQRRFSEHAAPPDVASSNSLPEAARARCVPDATLTAESDRTVGPAVAAAFKLSRRGVCPQFRLRAKDNARAGQSRAATGIRRQK
jgi:hypothetical protein